MTSQGSAIRLRRAVDPGRDEIRGGSPTEGAVTLLIYGDYLCPYCRSLRHMLARLREALGPRMAYVFRQFPNERAHPGAEFASRAALAAARQERFWPMHDALYAREPPLTREHIFDAARDCGLDMERFGRDLEDPEVARRVEADLADGRRDGVTGTPTIFIDGEIYLGAWDFYSMLEALQRPVGARVKRTARAFANLPASAGLVLLLAAAVALAAANSPLGPAYHALIDAELGVRAPGGHLSMTLGEWASEGLLAVFFLVVGLEIRREMSTGALVGARAAILPVLAALGGVLGPAAIYLAFNRGPTAIGWAVPTATDVAFTLGVLALLGARAPMGLKVFVAALAVVDDILSMITLAIFYPQAFDPRGLAAAAGLAAAMYALNRGRVYAGWPYLTATIALWLSLHAAGVHAALAGVVLAAFLPARPPPATGPLLAQAATALAELEHAESEGPSGHEEQAAVRGWARRNLSAASDRLLSPSERVEEGVSPWSGFVALPLFAFSATGIALQLDLGAPGAETILPGVVIGMVLGKPLGIGLAALLAVKARIASMPEDVGARQFLGGACLCGVGYTVALLLADQAFADAAQVATAKIGVLAGSTLAAVVGVLILALGPRAGTPAPAAAEG